MKNIFTINDLAIMLKVNPIRLNSYIKIKMLEPHFKPENMFYRGIVKINDERYRKLKDEGIGLIIKEINIDGLECIEKPWLLEAKITANKKLQVQKDDEMEIIYCNTNLKDNKID